MSPTGGDISDIERLECPSKKQESTEINDPLPQINPSPTFPDGGLQAWLTVAGAFSIQICTFGYTSSFGVYEDFYVREYITNASPSAISWIGSLNAFLMISGGLVAGRLYDRGYFYFLLWGGTILTSFSLFMLSLAKPNHYYQIFLSQAIGAGIGGGFLYVPSVAVVSQYFKKGRALAMTIVASGASFGAVFHPIMLNHTLPMEKLGFANAVRASAGLITGLLLFACLVMRTRLPVQKNDINVNVIIKRSIHEGPYVAATVGLAIFSVGFYFPQFYLQLASTSHHLNATFSFYSLVILNFSSIVGRIASGFVANRLGVDNLVALSSACASAIILGIIGLNTVASVVVLGMLYGFFAGIFIGLLSPLLAILSPNLSELGIRMGISFFFSGIGALIGSPISGALLTDQLIWWRPALFSGLSTFTGSLLFFSVIFLRRRKRETEDQC